MICNYYMNWQFKTSVNLPIFFQSKLPNLPRLGIVTTPDVTTGAMEMEPAAWHLNELGWWIFVARMLNLEGGWHLFQIWNQPVQVLSKFMINIFGHEWYGSIICVILRNNRHWGFKVNGTTDEMMCPCHHVHHGHAHKVRDKTSWRHLGKVRDPGHLSDFQTLNPFGSLFWYTWREVTSSILRYPKHFEKLLY